MRATPLALALLAAALSAGCAGLSSPSMKVVPPEWRKNHPWGPEAYDLREQGLLPCWQYTAKMARWAEFGRRHLQDGDLVFRMGLSCTLRGNFTSRLLGAVGDGPFSHDGIVRRDGDRVWVYDVELEGVRKLPFEVWMLDVADQTLTVRRLKPEYRARIPQVLAFCEEAFRKDVPFDLGLSPSADEYYCTEMIERAFRSAGLPLTGLVRIRDLPHYRRFAWVTPLAERLTPLRVDYPVVPPGNACYGQYASPLFETVCVGNGARRFFQRPHDAPRPGCGGDLEGAPPGPPAAPR